MEIALRVKKLVDMSELRFARRLKAHAPMQGMLAGLDAVGLHAWRSAG